MNPCPSTIATGVLSRRGGRAGRWERGVVHPRDARRHETNADAPSRVRSHCLHLSGRVVPRSHPLSGMKILTRWKVSRSDSLLSCFRPLSGMKVLTLERESQRTGESQTAFPSPLGDESLNTRGSASPTTTASPGFRPLSGMKVLTHAEQFAVIPQKALFPSPLGDEGLNTGIPERTVRQQCTVPVPSRG